MNIVTFELRLPNIFWSI